MGLGTRVPVMPTVALPEQRVPPSVATREPIPATSFLLQENAQPSNEACKSVLKGAALAPRTSGSSSATNSSASSSKTSPNEARESPDVARGGLNQGEKVLNRGDKVLEREDDISKGG